MAQKRKRSAAARTPDLAFRPKSYWPPRVRRANEVEVARVAIASSSADAIILKARALADGRIHYRMVHEDHAGRTSHRIRARPASSTRCLTLGELISMLEGACYTGPCPDEGDDERFGGVIWGTLRLYIEHGVEHADDYIFHLRVTSKQYPQLEPYYRERLSDWCIANCIEDDDCRKLVRLRAGRYPRKLVLPA